MAHVSHKLSNSVEGALAGGGDPATSPLYVFGPFLRLIVVAGVAAVTFGTSIWLVVFTIAMVSAMYRLVMTWVTDGSGGSGLSGEEFGGWAVKVNAGITVVEYTLTFLVSMAAMVTFIADRVPALNASFYGIQYRTIVAIVLSVLTGWLVNRGPKTAARAFGPATAGVLLLLWAMVIATIWQYGLRLPDFNMQAFSLDNIKYTFGGFTRMLAVMTGIEVFANLVAAYDGTPQKRSNKAFRSLLIIMGTTAVVMIIVGPAIYQLSNPANTEVSVFTQTMDQLLPQSLAYIGTLVGIAVLLSASAASAQGIQNLSLGLKNRNYIPSFLGERNKYDVADKPVWLQIGLVVIIFLVAGTNEETYLAIYAAGVFILLSMTGWAASKRLLRILRETFSTSNLLTLIGTVIAAAITTAATLVIFEERFFEGAWTYFIFIPLLYIAFTYSRSTLGSPSPVAERLGELEEAMLGGFGFGQSFEPALATAGPIITPLNPLPAGTGTTLLESGWKNIKSAPTHIVVPLDGSQYGEQAIHAARDLCTTFDARLTLLSALKEKYRDTPLNQDRQKYLDQMTRQLMDEGLQTESTLRFGLVEDRINDLVREQGVDMVVMSSHGRSGLKRWLMGGVATGVLKVVNCPVLIIHPRADEGAPEPLFRKLLVTLDGSEYSERVLPYVKSSAEFNSKVILLRIPEVPEAEMYGAVLEEIQELREEAEAEAQDYLECVAAELGNEGIETRVIVQGSRPAQTIISVADEEQVDVIMMATHGRGGLQRLFVGSVADRVVHHTDHPVFLVPIQERRNTK
ncbi:MAG: universal stress protein [Chloroflexota bacterium]|nr:universal stress protein [Chloroflexota bacterium]